MLKATLAFIYTGTVTTALLTTDSPALLALSAEYELKDLVELSQEDTLVFSMILQWRSFLYVPCIIIVRSLKMNVSSIFEIMLKY